MARQTRDGIFAEIAMGLKLLTREQVDECLRVRDQLTGMGLAKRTLSQIAVEKQFLAADQVKRVHKEMIKRGFYPRIGGYEVLEQVGAGGMGVVCKARQLSLDRIVAVKLLAPHLSRDAAYVARFQREARLAAKIVHPNAVHIYDVGEDAGRHYIVMEFVDGVPVENLLVKEPLSETRALQIVRDVGRALEKAHEAGIIHRDIKPGNILVTPDGTPKLSDLGLAKQLSDVAGASLTATGAVSGTPHYMSPEQCRGDKTLDQRSDIYSLGITLYKMVCGREPYAGDTPVTIMHKHLEEPLPDPQAANPTVSPATAQLIRDMTAKDPSERIQSCAEVVQRVCAILGTTPSMPAMQAAAVGPSTSAAATLPLSETPTLPVRPVPGRRGLLKRIPIWVWPAALVLVGVMVGVGFAVAQRQKDSGAASPDSGSGTTVTTPNLIHTPKPPRTTHTTAPGETPKTGNTHPTTTPDETASTEDLPRGVEDAIRDIGRHMREKSDPVGDMMKMRQMLKGKPIAEEPDGSRVITVRAYVEGTSVMFLAHGRAFWLNVEGAAPGKGNRENNPTYFDKREWMPEWYSQDDVPTGKTFSKPFFMPDLLPPMNRLSGRLIESDGPASEGKPPVLLGNRMGNIALVFINGSGTAAWFTAKVEVAWSAAVPPKGETEEGQPEEKQPPSPGDHPSGGIRRPGPWGGKRTPPTRP